MAYRVRPDGTIECDSASEAVALSRALSNGHAPSTGAQALNAEEGARLTISRYREFVSYLNAAQKKFLGLLVDNPHGKTDSAIRQTLGLEGNKALGGFRSGLSKLAKKSGLDVADVLTVRWVKIGDQDSMEYQVTPQFRNIVDNVGGLK